MSEQKKTPKRKLLIRYLILAACILLIAAVTVITVCAVNDWFKPQISIDSGDVNNPDKPGEPDEPNKPTDTDNSALHPVTTFDVIKDYDFHKDESLMGAWHFHEAVDLAGKVGDKVVACLDGTVESVTVDDKLDATVITIAHEGNIKTRYMFVTAREGLKKGDKVKRGEQIGTIAEATGSEYKQGPHLHFEVERNGKLINPAEFLDIADK